MIQKIAKIVPIIVKILVFKSISAINPAIMASVKIIKTFIKYCFLAFFEKNRLNAW